MQRSAFKAPWPAFSRDDALAFLLEYFRTPEEAILQQPVMRVLRRMRGETLEQIGAALGFRKSALSSAERLPNAAASLRMKRALALHYGAPWELLAASVDGEILADSIIQTLTKGS
jgi:hypothetical protein